MFLTISITIITLLIVFIVWASVAIYREDKELRKEMDILRPNPEPESRIIDPIIVEAARRYVREKEKR
jgi:hypothetical protein